jgi:U3 small nucleolar RNA-associated protein 11
MMSSKVDSAGRRIQDRGNKVLSQEVVKLLKTQDAAYIRTMLQMVRKERRQLEEKILLEGQEVRPLGREEDEVPKGTHVVYVRDQEEQEKFEEDEWFGKGGEWPRKEEVEVPKQLAEDEDEDEEVSGKKQKKLSKKELEKQLLAEKEQRALRRQRERTKERMLIHLEAVKKRERELVAAEDELELQRAKMNNTVGGVNKNGVKFKLRERKK